MDCAACKQPITTSRMLNCACCKTSYHPVCVNAGTTDITKLIDWKCPMCRAREPKNGNSNTPVRAPNLPDVSNANASSRAQKRVALSSPNGEDFESDPVASELRLLRLDMAEIKACLMLLTEGVGKCTSRLDSFESRIKALEERDPIILTLRDTIHQLQDQLNQQTQAAMKNELEIIGINETSNENLEHIVTLVATKVGVNLPESDIDWVARAGPKNRKINGRDINSPRPIIVKFTKKAKRDEIIKATKVRRHIVITSADIDLQGPPRSIYVNEHLSKANRLLFRDARLRAKELGYRFCWINNGRVHMRREEGKPAISIRTPEDLDQLLPSAAPGPNRPSSCTSLPQNAF